MPPLTHLPAILHSPGSKPLVFVHESTQTLSICIEDAMGWMDLRGPSEQTIPMYQEPFSLNDDAEEHFSLSIRTSCKSLSRPCKRQLLYKHDDDLRQELFALQFVKACDSILKFCGLDLKLLQFDCIPVGPKSGFVEWVDGSVPLSEICRPSEKSWTQYESLHKDFSKLTRNPIQEYLRSFGYSAEDPYCIEKSVMDTYVKSCAGYFVITYILGVGDRHLDNLLLHPKGHLFHCDYSFILGNDPKKYLPVRMTEDMVAAMGGRESDSFDMFLSQTCAAFLTLRRPENLRYLLSLTRLMEGCELPDVEVNQSLEESIYGIRERLRLDLTEEGAMSFLETLIEESCSSRMWIAVDAIHTLGKHF